MKKILLLVLSGIMCLHVYGNAEVRENSHTLFPIDKVVAIVDGPERRYVICQSELERVGIDGRKPTLDDLILEEIVYQKALKYKMPLEDMAEKYIRNIKQYNNIGDKEVDQIFERSGLTPEAGRLKLQKMAAMAAEMDMVKSKIYIDPVLVEAEDNKNPKFKPTKYQLEVAFVPFFSQERNKIEEQNAFLIDQIEHGQLDVVWGTPFWIKDRDLVEDKKFITHMVAGSISKPVRVQGGYELYRLKDKREQRRVPLERRRRKILDDMREPKLHELFDAEKAELYKTASVIYVSP